MKHKGSGNNHLMPLLAQWAESAQATLRPLLATYARWWRRQSPARQDRFATLGPLFSVMLFLAAIVLAFWYLRNEELERETEAVKRDTEIAQQQIRLRLIENQEQLARMAREVVTRQISPQDFAAQAMAFARERPEVTHITWLNAQRDRRASISSTGFQANHLMVPGSGDPSMPSVGNAPDQAFILAKERRQTAYSGAFRDAIGSLVFQVHVPLVDRNGFGGALIAEYGVEALLRYYVPNEVTARHPMAIVDDTTLLASTAGPPDPRVNERALIAHDVPLSPAFNGLRLRGTGYRTSIGLISNTLFWMVVALAVLTVWMLLGTWRHMRRRLHMQNALLAETNFRRAMENSMLTGMRALDMESRIAYVNPSFCAMTGFTEAELLGCRPPFPFWPRDRLDENQRLLDQEMQGRSPSGGVEVKVMRKDGSVFDARMYVSPLVDPKGKQTGWMTSMTNITEAKRVRDQLSASHERFTTVLEGLDAAVSVVSVPAQELLFANRSYRVWFGAENEGHLALAQEPVRPAELQGDSVDDASGLPAQELTDASGAGIGTTPREVYVDSVDRWFDVRTRYLQWTDGRLAQMLIATDITQRRAAEQQAQVQAEKAQVTSRLITMGEMASSVAHELNQPLTAITNYCNGMISRVKGDTIAKDDLLAALEKTSKQAQRAGQVIHRIRAFVKKSEPQRVPAQAANIVDDAVELASFELRRRNVQLHTYVAQRLPALSVDPILIEQVLLNLLKNAAEAIDNAKLPPSRRHVELRVVPRHMPDQGGTIEFAVTDTGPGLPEEVLDRMFEAFYSTKTDGLGIGLGLCRSIVESHKGRLRAENLYNGELLSGCRFSFTIPVDAKPADTAAHPLMASNP
jgi:PAS domain S-box-containing protein